MHWCARLLVWPCPGVSAARTLRGVEAGRDARVHVAQQVRRLEQLRLVLEPLRRTAVTDPAAFDHVGVLREPKRHVRELLDQKHADTVRGDGVDVLAKLRDGEVTGRAVLVP